MGKKKLKRRVKDLEADLAELSDAVKTLEDARDGVFRWTAPSPYWQTGIAPSRDFPGTMYNECDESTCG